MELHYYECDEESGKEVSFDYEVDDDKAYEVIEKEFCKEFDVDSNAASSIISEFELESILEERYEEALKEHFSDEAWEAYADAKEYEADPLGYYGMSIHDFI